MTDHVRYAAWLASRSDALVAAVRDDGPDELLRVLRGILAANPPPDVDPVVALVTVLAAQIPPDVPRGVRLGWVRAFEAARPLRLAADPWDEAEVTAVLAGELTGHQVSRRARTEAVRRLAETGRGSAEIAARVGIQPDSAGRIVRQAGA